MQPDNIIPFPAQSPAPAKPEPLTCQIRGGRRVLAKNYKGLILAKTYTNRTQAETAAGALGAGWEAFKGMGRPFFVTKIETSK